MIRHTIEAYDGELCELEIIETQLEPALRSLLVEIRRDWSFPSPGEAFLADTRQSRYEVRVGCRTAVVNRWSVLRTPTTSADFAWALYWFWSDEPTRQLCTHLVETEAEAEAGRIRS